jgi:NTE family protein
MTRRGRPQTPPSVESVDELFASSRVFAGLPPEARTILVEGLDWVCIPGGESVEDLADQRGAAWLILHGRLRVSHPIGERQVVEEPGAGSLVGSLGMLSSSPDFKAVALRDTELAVIHRETLAAAAAVHPPLWASFAEEVAQRAQVLLSGRPEPVRARHVAVLPADPGAPLAEFTSRLAASLGKQHNTLILDRATFEAALGSGSADDDVDVWDGTDRKILAWIARQESTYGFILFQADADWGPWTRRCIRQSDSVLVVARADSDPSLTTAERELLQDAAVHAISDNRLVLLHRAGTEDPSGTSEWLDRRPGIDRVHHVRLDRIDHYERLARHINGTAVGLVLGGGGARGQAHIGAVRALREVGIPIDAVGGTSAGGGIGALAACEWDFDRMKAAVFHAFVVLAPFHAYSVPFHSLMHKPAVEAPAKFLGGARWIEDLWLPFFCVSCDISRSKKVVHRRGRLWKALRATTALPGVLPPVVMRGMVLVDGGIVDNTPVELMRQTADGPTILINVSPPEQELLGREVLDLPLNLDVIISHMHPMLEPITVPSLPTVVISTMTMADAVRAHHPPPDLLIRPDIGAYGMTNFEPQEELIALGYNATMEALEAAPPALLARLGADPSKLTGARMTVPVWLSRQRALKAGLRRTLLQSGFALVFGLALAGWLHSTVFAESALIVSIGLALVVGLYPVVRHWQDFRAMVTGATS